MSNDTNILFADEDNGVLILLGRNDWGDNYKKYPIILDRQTLGCRFHVAHGKKVHDRHVRVMAAFKNAGWNMKLTLNGRFYTVAKKKDRFRFLLQHGKHV